MYLNGEFIQYADREIFPILNPATEELITRSFSGSVVVIDSQPKDFWVPQSEGELG